MHVLTFLYPTAPGGSFDFGRLHCGRFCWFPLATQHALQPLLDSKGQVERHGAVDRDLGRYVAEVRVVGTDRGRVARGQNIKADVELGEVAGEAGGAQNADSSSGRKRICDQQDVQLAH